jgi:hypothetical protein
MVAALKAVTAIGTSCSFSSRRCAVTTISSRPPVEAAGWSAGAAFWAKAGKAKPAVMAEAARSRLRRPLRDGRFMVSTFFPQG